MHDGLVNIAPDFLKEGYNFWEDNMQLAIMHPFSQLYNRDNSKNKTISSKEMVCIFFLSEPDPQMNKFYRITEEERLSMLKDTYHPDFDEQDEIIAECIEAWPELLSAVKRAMKEEIDSMRERAKFIRNFDYKTAPLADIEKLDRIRAKTTALLEGYEKIKNKFLKEKDAARVVGGRRESKSEQGKV